ncbi:MAG: pyridoxal phosphate-dependent aminotransferase, partial [Geminicoccaceae bacterium]
MTGVTARRAAAMPTPGLHVPSLRLDLNECPYPPPPSVTAAIAAAAAHVNRYPPSDDTALMTELAAYCGAAEARIVLTSGSNELLHLLPLIAGALGPEAEIVVADPSFPTYVKVAGFYGVTVRSIPVSASGAADIDAMLAAVTPACRLICVSSPNNPTGGMLEAAAIKVLAAGVPDTAFLHFDEAYYEFGYELSGVETLSLLAERKGPWITSRSFSKAFGLAGIRLGYSIAGSDELARYCRSLRPNFNV